jgi:hypothetical protein
MILVSAENIAHYSLKMDICSFRITNPSLVHSFGFDKTQMYQPVNYGCNMDVHSLYFQRNPI